MAPRARPGHTAPGPVRARWAGLAALVVLAGVLLVGPWSDTWSACDRPTITFRWGGDQDAAGEPDLRWENPTNWDEGRVPSTRDRVCVPDWPHGAPEVHGASAGGVIDASRTTIMLRGGSLTVGESLAARTLVVHAGELRGPGTQDVGTLRLAEPAVLDLVSESACLGPVLAGCASDPAGWMGGMSTQPDPGR